MFKDLDILLSLNASSISYRCKLPFAEGTSLVIINILGCIMGSTGNIIISATIYSTARLHTISSYFICGLAATDLMVTLLVQPMAAAILLRKTTHGQCLIHVEYAARIFGNISCSASILTLCFMSLDRCVVILKPLKYRKHMTTTKLKIIFTFIWSLSLVSPALDAFVSDKKFYTLFTVIGIVICYAIISFSYFLIFVHVRRQSKLRLRLQGDNQSCRFSATSEAEKKLAKTVGLVMGVFTLFWAPFLYRMISFPNVNYGAAYIWCITAGMTNSSCNPVIYFYKGDTFRAPLKNMLIGRFGYTKWRRNRVGILIKQLPNEASLTPSASATFGTRPSTFSRKKGTL